MNLLTAPCQQIQQLITSLQEASRCALSPSSRRHLHQAIALLHTAGEILTGVDLEIGPVREPADDEPA